MGTFAFFALLTVLPAGIISVLGAQRGCRHAWLYALAAYAIGPLALMMFLWRESFKHCPICRAECSWDALACRTCLAPFPMTPKSTACNDDMPAEGWKESRMPHGVSGTDPAACVVVTIPQQECKLLTPALPDEDLTHLGHARFDQQVMQVTINVTQVSPSSEPTVVWRVCRGVARSPWMPWYPFALIYRSYKEGFAEAARYPGLLRTIVWIGVATGLAAILWRHWTTPISIIGGLLAFLVISARTGQLQDVLDALQAAGGLPSLITVARYAWISFRRKEGHR